VLQDLNINTDAENKTSTPIDLTLAPKDIPTMLIRSEGVFLNGNSLPDFQVDLISNNEYVEIKNLEFDNINFDKKSLKLNGKWTKEKTQLTIKVQGKKLSKFLETIGIKEKVKGGRFEVNADLYCQCEPWKIKAKKINGYLNAKVKAGSFTNQGLGFGRLLSWINVASIVKRLQASNKNMNAKGLVYDSIDTSIKIKQGIVQIEKFVLLAPSSDIYLKGSSDLSSETYDLVAEVIPEIGDSVPIATYLAGGGTVGLGAWLLDKLLFKGKIVDTVFDKSLSFNYKITGTWQQPIIK
jgi:uncharacterized protein YhdP